VDQLVLLVLLETSLITSSDDEMYVKPIYCTALVDRELSVLKSNIFMKIPVVGLCDKLCPLVNMKLNFLLIGSFIIIFRFNKMIII